MEPLKRTVVKLPANQAWCLLLGEPSRGFIVSVDDRKLWDRRADLVAALKSDGYSTAKNGNVRSTW